MIYQYKKNLKNSDNDSPNPIDAYVGQRIRIRRQMLKLSQAKVASILGITPQQVQKYEQGNTRVGSSRLWDLSKILQVSISFFFDGVVEQASSQSLCKLYDCENVAAPLSLNSLDIPQLFDNDDLELIVALHKIKSPELRLTIRKLIHYAVD